MLTWKISKGLFKTLTNISDGAFFVLNMPLISVWSNLEKGSFKDVLKYSSSECWKILREIWNKVFKNGPSKIYGRQPLKYLKGYGLLKQLSLSS